MALLTGAANSSNKFLGNLSSDPSSGNAEGDLYYNTTNDLYRFYDGSAWKNVSEPALGTQANPGNSAKEILDAGTGSTNGLYYITVSGQGSVQVYCDQTKNGGGWTMVYATHHANAHNHYWPTSNTYVACNFDPRSSSTANTEGNLPNKYSDYGPTSGSNASKFMIETYDYGSGNADYIWEFTFTSSVGSTWDSGNDSKQDNFIPASLSNSQIEERCTSSTGVRPTTDSNDSAHWTDKASPGSAGNWDIGWPKTGQGSSNKKDANCGRHGGAGPGVHRSSKTILWVR